MNRLSTALAAFCCYGISMNSIAQEIDYPDTFNEPMKLFDSAMGDFHFPISSDSEMAQSDPVIDKDLFEALSYADIWMLSTKY